MSFTDEDGRRLLATGVEKAAFDGTDLARVLGAFRKELLAQGFAPDEVWYLCREFFLVMIDSDGPHELGDDDED